MTVRAHVYRNGGWRWTNRAAAWFDLEFDRPVLVPRPLGADAHFGWADSLSHGDHRRA